MRIFYAVEANTIINDVPEFRALIFKETNVFDFLDSTFIYESAEDARHLEMLINEAGLFESQFELILVSNGVKGDTFHDFGIESSQFTYLLKELICPFSIKGGEKNAIYMASLQLQEHLVYKNSTEQIAIHFVEHHLEDLVKGIADAYDIEVSFFELDK